MTKANKQTPASQANGKTTNGKIKCALIGSGNIGTDIMMKIHNLSNVLEVGLVVGIDSESDGLKRARELGYPTTHKGIEGAVEMPLWQDIQIAIDATSAAAHYTHNEIC
ncbi:MAG: hypothetical protein OXT03_03755, partial [Alphaproteobacteria bacterium]|nr:hypothetical protein [Alphaproteobacteria bacterium]